MQSLVSEKRPMLKVLVFFFPKEGIQLSPLHVCAKFQKVVFMIYLAYLTITQSFNLIG